MAGVKSFPAVESLKDYRMPRKSAYIKKKNLSAKI